MLGNAFRRIAQLVRDLPLERKGLLVVAIPLSGLLLGLAVFALVQRENRDAALSIPRTLEIRSLMRMVHSHIEESEIGALGYLATRDEAWLRSFQDTRRLLHGLLDRLERTVAGDPSQEASVRHLRSLVSARVAELEALTARVPPPAGSDRALSENRLGLEAFRREATVMRREGERLLEQRLAHAEAVANLGYVTLIGGVLFIPAAAILAMLLFARTITSRIHALDAAAHCLAEGEPVALARSGRDEIGRLEQSLSAAAALLADHEGKLRQAAAELETRVEERTAELAAEVAERKRAEEDLAEANRRLRALIDSSPLAILRLDLDGTVRAWNRAAERIFGWTEEEALGRPLRILPTPEETPDWLARAARGEELTAVPARRSRKDGSLVEVRLWAAPLRNAAGEISGAIAIYADFTEQRRLEQQLAQAQKMEAIGRLAGGAAHDFNNLITVIAGYGQMLLAAVQDNPALRDAAQEVLRASDRAASLAGQLLLFSRRQANQPRVIDLNGLVNDLKNMLGRVMGEDVELKTELEAGLGAVRADPGQIEQVIVNLAINARDAMPAGGRLLLETANVEIGGGGARAIGLEPGPYVMLAIGDTGSGMSAAVKSHVFEPFFTTKERGRGTGLGLSTVYGIVKQHGGGIFLYSEPERGATFKIYLPRAEEAAAESPPPELRPAPRGDETVLVVEDEEGVRRLIRDILEQQGYHVLDADGGERALEIVNADERGAIALLVTDVVMPHMSGRDLAQAVALLRPEVKVLFLSGYTDRAAIEHGLGSAAAFLQKPFSPEALARKVRGVLDAQTGAGA